MNEYDPASCRAHNQEVIAMWTLVVSLGFIAFLASATWNL
jgi:hypothetical protein